MLLFFIHFRSDARVLPGSRRGAEIAAPLRAHTAELTSHTDFLMVTFLRFQKPGVAVHSPATQVGNGVFFGSATIETGVLASRQLAFFCGKRSIIFPGKSGSHPCKLCMMG